MSILIECICAVALCFTGALLSGGIRLPERHQSAAFEQSAAENEDLSALLRYCGMPEEQEESCDQFS